MSLQPRLFVTGATGLVGSHLLLYLAQQAVPVRAFVRNKQAAQKRMETVFAWYKQSPTLITEWIEWVEGDVLDLGSLEDALEGIEQVIHTAAVVRENGSSENMEKVNVEGTANLVNLCLELGIKRFVHLSSVATLGPNPEGLVDEDFFFKYNPRLSNYALTKYASEQEVWRACEEGLEVIVLNPAFIIGPSESMKSSSSVFSAAANGIPYYTNGLGGYVDVRDVAEIAVKCLTVSSKNKRYIISSENLETREFLQATAISMNGKVPVKALKEWMIRPTIWFFGLRKMFTGKEAPFTRSVVRMAQSRNAFDASRIIELTGIQFRPVKEAIADTAAIMRQIKVDS